MADVMNYCPKCGSLNGLFVNPPTIKELLCVDCAYPAKHRDPEDEACPQCQHNPCDCKRTKPPMPDYLLDPDCAGCIGIPNKLGVHTCERRKGVPYQGVSDLKPLKSNCKPERLAELREKYKRPPEVKLHMHYAEHGTESLCCDRGVAMEMIADINELLDDVVELENRNHALYGEFREARDEIEGLKTAESSYPQLGREIERLKTPMRDDRAACSQAQYEFLLEEQKDKMALLIEKASLEREIERLKHKQEELKKRVRNEMVGRALGATTPHTKL